MGQDVNNDLIIFASGLGSKESILVYSWKQFLILDPEKPCTRIVKENEGLVNMPQLVFNTFLYEMIRKLLPGVKEK